MANRKNNISDNKVKKASGGGTKYNEDIKEWGVYDDDDPINPSLRLQKIEKLPSILITIIELENLGVTSKVKKKAMKKDTYKAD